MEHTRPADIERASLAIIRAELADRGVALPEDAAPVVLRVIHTTADFDYAENLRFSPGAVDRGIAALKAGADIVTDTRMAQAGLSKPSLAKLGGRALCFIGDEDVAAAAAQNHTTRAVAALDKAAAECPGAVLAVGNAPTALLRPALVIAAPVGFVNVVESKERVWRACRQAGVPIIAAMGRKGGSGVAAAIGNALLYSAANALDPAARGWQG